MDISNPLTPIAAAALDALSLNQKLLASNIANVNTQGYTSSRINFETYMASVIESDVSTSMTSHVQKNIGTVHLDMELAAMSENLQRYRAIIDLMNRQSGIMSLAMKGRSS